MSALPFLNSRKVPRLRTQVGESRYGFSEDEELCEHALKELSEAVDSKDHKRLMDAIKALVECMLAKHSRSEDADS